jgi:hypothetical protein
MPQRRQFSRVFFRAGATLASAGSTQACEVLDLSLKGALLRLPADQPAPTGHCRLELTLDADQEVRIGMEAEVAHHEGDVIGLHCLSIDLDSITHLRRLVELNLGDDSLLQRELSALSSE